MRRLIIPLVLPVLLSACSLLGIRSGYEQPGYEVIDRVGESVEIRDYGTRLAAEASVPQSSPESGRNDLFRLLFDYISGDNRADAGIAMTSPVESDRTSATIAMTAPVETARPAAGRAYMRFFLPAEYDRDTVPEPTDPRVRIVEVPAQILAVLRFSGSRSEAEVARRKAALLSVLDESGWRAVAEPVAYFYDPPWTLPFFRRNEVAVAVTR